MLNLAIRSCTSQLLIAPSLKIVNLAEYCTPDLLNQRQTCYHLSQRGWCIYFICEENQIYPFVRIRSFIFHENFVKSLHTSVQAIYEFSVVRTTLDLPLLFPCRYRPTHSFALLYCTRQSSQTLSISDQIDQLRDTGTEFC